MATATTIGHMSPFEPDNERIMAYLERVQLFIEVNGIAEEKHMPTLLSVIGGKIYTLL